MHQRFLKPILSTLRDRGFTIEVETNGTLAPEAEIVQCVDSFNVSPKTSNSLVPGTVRTRPGALRALSKTNKAWFKFVVCSPTDLAEVEGMVSKFELPRDRVFLMPEGADVVTLAERTRWVVEACKSHQFRFSPRMHILVYGNKRGT